PPLAPPATGPASVAAATGGAARPVAPPEHHAALTAQLRRWRDGIGPLVNAELGVSDNGAAAGNAATVIGALRARADQPNAAFLAVVVLDGRSRLLGGRTDRGAASDEPE